MADNIQSIKNKIVNLYEKIQNIPYGFSVPRNPDLLISRNKGGCSEKGMFLAKQFRNLGIPVRFLVVRFDWNTTPVPKDIVKIRKSPNDWHLAIEIKPDNKWIYVDAAFDPSLESLGFPITKNWDGVSDTKFAVKPLYIITLPFFTYWFLKKLVRLRQNTEPKFQIAFSQYLESKK